MLATVKCMIFRQYGEGLLNSGQHYEDISLLGQCRKINAVSLAARYKAMEAGLLYVFVYVSE